MSTLFTKALPDGGRAWATISGPGTHNIEADWIDKGWQPATGLQRARWELFRNKRWSIVDLVIILTIAAALQTAFR